MLICVICGKYPFRDICVIRGKLVIFGPHGNCKKTIIDSDIYSALFIRDRAGTFSQSPEKKIDLHMEGFFTEHLHDAGQYGDRSAVPGHLYRFNSFLFL